jgi:hypothetical protein
MAKPMVNLDRLEYRSVAHGERFFAWGRRADSLGSRDGKAE